MKKFLTLLLCFQFLVMPISLTYAEDLTSGVDESDPSLQEARAYEGMGYDFVFKQLIVMGVSLVASNIWLQCPQALIFPSVMAMEAASAVYLGYEIYGAQDYKAAQQSSLESYKIGEAELVKEGTQDQKDILDLKLTNEQNLKKFLESKKNWIGAIHAAFTVALIFAILEATSDKFLAVFTVGGTQAANAVNAAACSNPITSKAGRIAASIAISSAYGFTTGFGSSGGLVSGIGQGLIGLLSLFGDVMSPVIGFAAAEPIGRVVTTGAFVALLIPVEIGLYERAAQSEKNIEDMKKVIKDFKVLSEDTGEGSEFTEDPSLPTADQKTGSLTKIATNNVKSAPTCMGADGSISSKSCNNPRKFPKREIEFGDLNTLNSAFSNLTDMANSAASGNMAGANASAANLNAMAGSLRKILAKVKKNFNEQRVAEGKEPIDIDKGIAQKAQEIQALYNKAAAQSNLPNLAQGSGGIATLDQALPVPEVAAAPVAAPTTPTGDKKPSFDFGFDDEEAPQDTTAIGDVAQTGQGIDQFEANVADISNKTDVSIFVQLSNRYLLNYNKIFKKLEEKPKPPEAPKKEESAKK